MSELELTNLKLPDHPETATLLQDPISQLQSLLPYDALVTYRWSVISYDGNILYRQLMIIRRIPSCELRVRLQSQ